MATGVGIGLGNFDVTIQKCHRSCLTCSSLVFNTSFKSSITGHNFDCIFDFEKSEDRTISCKSTNLIYLLECDGCLTQYVGETVQELKERMGQHRATTRPGDKGNYRLRQHFMDSGGACKLFSIRVIQKLAGSGRLNKFQLNSKKYEINPAVSHVRKKCEDNWIRRLGTQFPYGLNDRIDNLPDKNKYNCEYAKFISQKVGRKRSWCKGRDIINSQPNTDSIVEKL